MCLRITSKSTDLTARFDASSDVGETGRTTLMLWSTTLLLPLWSTTLRLVRRKRRSSSSLATSPGINDETLFCRNWRFNPPPPGILRLIFDVVYRSFPCVFTNLDQFVLTVQMRHLAYFCYCILINLKSLRLTNFYQFVLTEQVCDTKLLT